MANILEPIKTH